jgi:hypothetical protein
MKKIAGKKNSFAFRFFQKNAKSVKFIKICRLVIIIINIISRLQNPLFAVRKASRQDETSQPGGFFVSADC